MLPRLLAAALALFALGARADVNVAIKDAKGAAVPDAVIALYALDGAPDAPGPTGAVEIAQIDQEYVPFVTVVRAGTKVVFPNHDNIQHHIYSLSKAKRFEKPLYAPGSHEAVVFDQPGIVTIGCNIHDWMVAYVVVLPTPFFAKTDAAGRATVLAPSGRYRVEVWHPRLAAAETREVTLTVNPAALDYVLKLKPDRRIRRAPEGKAGSY